MIEVTQESSGSTIGPRAAGTRDDHTDIHGWLAPLMEQLRFDRPAGFGHGCVVQCGDDRTPAASTVLPRGAQRERRPGGRRASG